MISYRPDYTKQKDPELIRWLMRQYPFATLLTVVEGIPHISHLPLVLFPIPGGHQLVGHLSRANKHFEHLETHSSLAIFHGPHTYINPGWYQSADVPTWNYCVVHADLRCRLDSSEKSTLEALRLLTQSITEMGYEPWEFAVPADLSNPKHLTKAIVSFRAEIINLEAKFKLSQNRSVKDISGVIAGLRQRDDKASSEVAQLMQDIAHET